MAWLHPPAIGCRFSFLHLPCGRCGHTMSVFENSLIVFGGYDGKSWLCDLHQFDINSLVWSQPSLKGYHPQPRQYHAASIIDSSLYIYGGYNGSIWLKDLVIADLKEKKWKYPATFGNQPTAKEGLAMASINKCIFVHGGWNGVSNGDLHKYDTLTNEWTLLKIDGFKPKLCGHSMTIVKEKLFIFGGFDGTNWVNTLYILDPFKENKWTEPIVFGAPVARGYHSAVLFNKHILIYAGYNGKYILADIVALDIETLTWFLPDTCSGHFPTARNAHTMVLHGSQLYLFGGYNGSRDTNELHVLETSAFSSLHEDFRQVFNFNSWQDLVLENSSASCGIHLVILKSRAPQLFNKIIERNPELLQFKHIGSFNIGPGSPESLKLFCEYLYSDLNREKITKEVVEDLLYFAFKYNLPRLKALCLKVTYEGNENIPDSTLALDIMKCKDEVELSDFTVFVKDKAFKVHKIVLSARCQYFRAMLNSGMKDSKNNFITFYDLDPKAFEIIVEWMYSDKFLPLFTESSLDLEIGKELLSATNFLQLESLMRITEITLWKLIDNTNAFRMFAIACLFSTSQLKSYCINYILRQFDKASIQKELPFLSKDAYDELSKYLPKRITRQTGSNFSNELVMVKYDKDEQIVNNEPVMISGRLFESLKITKKMCIKSENLQNSLELISGNLNSNVSMYSDYRAPLGLKLKPRIQLNIRGVNAGRQFDSIGFGTHSKVHKRKPRSYKSQTLVLREESKTEEKPNFLIKGIGSCRKGKSRMNSLVNLSLKSRDILSSAELQIYNSAEFLSNKLLLPSIK